MQNDNITPMPVFHCNATLNNDKLNRGMIILLHSILYI